MARLPGRAPDLRSQSGYSLIELVTVMAILGLVLAGLAAMFQAGVRAEVRTNRQFQAQLNARLAMDRMRRELHCANAISAPNGTPVATIAVTLPDSCPGTATSVSYATVAVSAGRWQLTRAADAGTPVIIADYLVANTPSTSSVPFTYYVPGSGTLGRLRVDLPVNLDPSDTTTDWRLQDDIVLRNTIRL